ncbi:hypothetical protein CC80DRAFT_39531 [Byssothecium circinans]|uniref:Uncharacterized protein n=1 Tax=Byssothecium circinans TaxID=147558 RepID=A0A6A5U186_9PLEO|nr:hypothetical protein CC80DRAFT_39531 [Byssothecium circinans]
MRCRHFVLQWHYQLTHPPGPSTHLHHVFCPLRCPKEQPNGLLGYQGHGLRLSSLPSLHLLRDLQCIQPNVDPHGRLFRALTDTLTVYPTPTPRKVFSSRISLLSQRMCHTLKHFQTGR